MYMSVGAIVGISTVCYSGDDYRELRGLRRDNKQYEIVVMGNELLTSRSDREL